ncbi:MAG: hypothetical protein ACOC2C_01110 [Cyclonatronaceae bacterium]
MLQLSLWNAPDAQAQVEESEASSASAYSYLGLGTPLDYRSHQAAGMALIGVAIPDRSKASNANPAFWGGSYFTSMTAGLNLHSFDASNGSESATSSRLGFTQFQAQFPVLRERLGISVSLFPETESLYSITSSGSATLPTADSLSVVGYDVASSGTGGINRLEAGFGLRVTDNLYLGYAPSLMFGQQREENQLFYDNELFAPARFTQRTRYRAFAHRFGVMALGNELFRENDRLVFGATATLPVELSGERQITSQIVTGNVLNDFALVPESQNDEQDITFPLQTTAGLTYFPSQQMLVGVEAHYQQWSEHSGYDDRSEAFMKDRLRLGLGLEYDAFDESGNSFFGRMAYRFGASYDNGHLSFSGTDIETLLFSAGVGIPSPARGSSIDLSIEYGFRGTTDDSLIRERIFGLKASLNLSELMFVQRRFN